MLYSLPIRQVPYSRLPYYANWPLCFECPWKTMWFDSLSLTYHSRAIRNFYNKIIVDYQLTCLYQNCITRNQNVDKTPQNFFLGGGLSWFKNLVIKFQLREIKIWTKPPQNFWGGFVLFPISRRLGGFCPFTIYISLFPEWFGRFPPRPCQ